MDYTVKSIVKKSLEEITKEVISLYEKGKSVEEIANMCSIQKYLVESILVSSKGMYFR